MSTPTTDKPTVLRPPTRVREDPTLLTHPPVKPKPPVCADCKIEEMPNGEGIATVIIPPDVLKRLKMRAQGVSVGEYTWSFVIKPALYSAVY